MSESYNYKDLRLERSLRILDLYPASSSNAPIKLDLREALLDKVHGKFEALSYVWGIPDSKTESKIQCSGKEITIGANCDAALRRLRHRNRKRALFVDAICINQNNNKEKEGQVQLMGEIYNLARRVLVWLGEGSIRTDQAFKDFRRLFRIRRMLDYTDIAEKVRGWVWEHIRSNDARLNGDQPDKHLHFWLDFIHRQYFERVWPLQETAVASNSILICGSSTVSFEAAKFSIFFITPHLSEMIAGQDQKLFLDHFKGYETHSELAKLFHLKHHSDVWERPDDADLLRMVLFHVRRLQATNSLDRLYSLYTILKGFCPNFPTPEYSTSDLVLWSSATLAIVQATRCLDLLMDLHPNTREGDLPSWSYNWSPETDFSPFQWDASDIVLSRDTPSGTAWDTKPVPVLNMESGVPKRLRFKGRIHSKIKERSSDQKVAREWYCNAYLPSTAEDREDTPEFAAAFGEATKILFEWVIPKHKSESPIEHEDHNESDEQRAQELCRDLLIWEKIPGEPHYEYFQTWYPKARQIQWLAEDGTLNDPDDTRSALAMVPLILGQIGGRDRFHGQLCIKRMWRCFFMTEDGRIGDAFHTVKEGDLVVLLCWSKVPAILRPTEKDPSVYTLVCFAYVQGLVDCHQWDLKEEELEEFVLV